MTEEKKTLIDFPCQFPIKIVGINDAKFYHQIVEILYLNDSQFNVEAIVKNLSSNGKYLSLTAKIYALNQQHLDEIYRQLSTHPLAKFVL